MSVGARGSQDLTTFGRSTTVKRLKVESTTSRYSSLRCPDCSCFLVVTLMAALSTDRLRGYVREANTVEGHKGGGGEGGVKKISVRFF